MKETIIKKIGAIAMEAMLFEVSATPKPGLVDRQNSGAHCDMDFFTFMSSASALRNSFDEMIELGIEKRSSSVTEILNPLRRIGIQAENEMFRVTQGVNTHKGMIFTMGILAACAGYAAERMELTSQTLCTLAAEMCLGICGREYSGLVLKPLLTKGEKIFLQYGLTGVRGEVEGGYQTVLKTSLPVYSALRDENISVNDALVQTLLHLIVNTDDTNIVSRHDMETAQYAKTATRKVLEQGGILGKDGRFLIEELDQDFIKRHISPGGCADLLAVTHFLYTVEQMTL